MPAADSLQAVLPRVLICLARDEERDLPHIIPDDHRHQQTVTGSLRWQLPRPLSCGRRPNCPLG